MNTNLLQKKIIFPELKDQVICIVLFTFIIGLQACTSEPVKKSEIITFEAFKNRIPALKSSDLVDDIEFIPLETTHENLIGRISKLIKEDDKYYILDSKSARKILVFDSAGQFLFSFGNVGKGQGEYSNLIDFTIDSERKTFYMLDSVNKIIKTGMNGDFILEKKVPGDYNRIQDIIAHKGIAYGASGQQPGIGKKYQIIQFDKDLNPVGYSLPYLFSFPGTLRYGNRFYRYNNKINFVSVFENKIYSESDGTFSERYVFNVENKGLDLKDLTSDRFLMNIKGVYLFSYCVEGDDMIFMPMFYDGRPRMGIVQKCA